jgi:hypothetical protein
MILRHPQLGLSNCWGGIRYRKLPRRLHSAVTWQMSGVTTARQPAALPLSDSISKAWRARSVKMMHRRGRAVGLVGSVAAVLTVAFTSLAASPAQADPGALADPDALGATAIAASSIDDGAILNQLVAMGDLAEDNFMQALDDFQPAIQDVLAGWADVCAAVCQFF